MLFSHLTACQTRSNPLNDLTKNILLWVVIVLVLLAVFSRYMPTVGQTEEVR